jgi:hypothetical protein
MTARRPPPRRLPRPLRAPPLRRREEAAKKRFYVSLVRRSRLYPVPREHHRHPGGPAAAPAAGVGAVCATCASPGWLRAAPHLRALAMVGGLRGSPFWYTLAGPDSHEVIPTHARVRSIVILSAVEETLPLKVDTVTRLRRRPFFSAVAGADCRPPPVLLLSANT